MGFSSPGKKKKKDGGSVGTPSLSRSFLCRDYATICFPFSAILYVPPPVADSTQEKVVQ